MNFPFEINKVLPEEITKVDSKLQVCRQHGQDRYGYQELRKMLFEIVDKMGDASAKAQRLPGTITTGPKLENSNHHLYIMKDVSGEKNCVVGILKVGSKKLFVYDACKRQNELDPMCVLDFYVHESRQRMGCGRKLFDFMLANEGIPVKHMAVDRPSPKFLSFLKKHYSLHGQIPQVNNFVIFEGFFQNRKDARNGQSRFTSSIYPSSTAIRSRPNSGRKSNTPQSTLQINPHQQPPTPTQNHDPAEPPVLQRDGPPDEYRNMLNMHQTYQGRNGRFVLSETRPAGGATGTNPSSTNATKVPSQPSMYEQSYGNNSNNDWNLGMSGYLREQRMKQSVSNRYNPGRLW